MINKINTESNTESKLDSHKSSANSINSEMNNKSKNKIYGSNTIRNQNHYSSKASIIENTIITPEDLIGINKEINETKEIYSQMKIRNKYFNMDDSEFQFVHGDDSDAYDNFKNENGMADINPKELELKKLYKKLYNRCFYVVKIPKTIVKEVQFICARNEADSKNFFFTKESDSSVLDQKLKKDLINDIIKYIVGPEIEYVSFNK